MNLLTAGCGISQMSFPHWPTWVKYPTVTHELNHVNIGGPASGNEFLAHITKYHTLTTGFFYQLCCIQFIRIFKSTS